MRRILLVFFVLLLAAAYLIAKFLPLWALPVILVGLLVLGFAVAKLFGQKLLERLFLIPFQAKGKVLRGATTEVHSVTPAAPPAPEPEQHEDEPEEVDEEERAAYEAQIEAEDPDDVIDFTKLPSPPETEVSAAPILRSHTVEPQEPRNYYLVEVTVKPKAPTGSFTAWELGELMLVKSDAKPMEHDDEEDEALIRKLEVHMDGSWQEDEGWKLPGPQRLRMLVGVRPGLSRLKFRYYFELFGDVVLPPPLEARIEGG